MRFLNELEFEKALINRLVQKGWSENILKFKTEDELLKNWADIIFENNKCIDRLNDVPLSETEMNQIIEKINNARTPFNIHSFINGEKVTIKRDNPLDSLHFEKEVTLTIFERRAIAGGCSVYQIAEQPYFKKLDSIRRDRRGDLMLLINGMPLIHIELKADGHCLSEATNQIEKYTHEGLFSKGIFSLIQIFVAMTPSETVYFANPGINGKFLREFQFHWADFNNEVLDDWESIAEHLLAIPMAHMLIGLYTVADDRDKTLKVLRSYQYNAVSEIYKRVVEEFKDCKEIANNRGGYIWHTTGSGKTLTSFKAAQLIAKSDEADKVIFLVDRIELGNQSLSAYQGFADGDDSVSGTENTAVLLSKLLNFKYDKLIVTSIQKMEILSKNVKSGSVDLSKLNNKKVVVIVDECHRSTFGDMMSNITEAFCNALYFGFTGTPIVEENAKKGCTTPDIFGQELHRYTIADGIRDGNVLGFDPEGISTFDSEELKQEIALKQANASSLEEVQQDKNKKQVYLDFMSRKMTDFIRNGKLVRGIESYIPNSQYTEPKQKHKKKVVEHILKNFITVSSFRKFHGIFATSSINEAIEYYRLFKEYMKKEEYPQLNITAIFDPNFDNCDGCIYKEDGLVEILNDYNAKFNKLYTVSTASGFKKDVCARLSHNEPYLALDYDESRKGTVDLVIVVDQLLTGFDSKWINVLYLDKILVDEQIIQAFSRTNRLFNKTEKPHGIIKMYRKPNTMIANMNRALKIYSGDKPFGVFVDKLEVNLTKSNAQFLVLKNIFRDYNHADFSSIDNFDGIGLIKFAKEFMLFNQIVITCRVQGMSWGKDEYLFNGDNGMYTVKRLYTENDYYSLLQRYKELPAAKPPTNGDAQLPLDIDPAIIAIPTDLVDTEFMQSRFDKWLKTLNSGEDEEKALNNLHNAFSTLSKNEQKIAKIIIDDIHNGNLKVENNKSFRFYINLYSMNFKNKQILDLANFLGLPYNDLKLFLDEVNKEKPDEFGKLENIKKLADKQVLKANLEKKYNKNFILPMVQIELDRILRNFIKFGGFDINEY